MRYLHSIFASVLFAATLGAQAAQTVKIDFEDVFIPPPVGGPLGGRINVPVSGYKFTNLDVFYTDKYPIPITVGRAYSGVNAGAIRDVWPGPVVVKREDGGIFRFESVQFKAFEMAEVLTEFSVVGRMNGSIVGSVTMDATKSWQLALNDFGNIDELSFYMKGRFQAPLPLEGLAIDDLTLTAIPEPETYAMFLAGIGIVGFAARRKKTTT